MNSADGCPGQDLIWQQPDADRERTDLRIAGVLAGRKAGRHPDSGEGVLNFSRSRAVIAVPSPWIVGTG